jgi:eukaryotic-like serine/threonine-protein kinase
MDDGLIKFVRRKDYQLVEKLGRGGFGEAVLLLDPTINENFVCKKYSPMLDEDKEKFYSNFVEEIRLLFLLNHPNIVRIYNYHLYPEFQTGYLLMEHIKGKDIEDHVRVAPETLNSLFVQAIEGFSHLENNKILHRDIRPQNLLVSDDNSLKIIDFGFGKKISTTTAFDKSISLNWPFLPPRELALGKYNFQTELYYVGRLFESLIAENQLDHFQYPSLIKNMIAVEPSKRIGSFNEIKTLILDSEFSDLSFDETEKTSYRNFTKQLIDAAASIEQNTKYFDDIDKIILRLEGLFQSVMLEEVVPNPSDVLRVFLNGAYKFYKQNSIEVENVSSFLKFLKRSDKAKRNVIMRNLHGRLDNIKRHNSFARDLDDEVPF